MNKSTYNILLLSISFFLIHLSLGTMLSMQKVMVDSINKQYNVQWNSFLSSSIVYITFSFSNLVVPSILTKISTENCLLFSTFCHGFCFLIYLYPIKYALLLHSVVLGFCGAILWTSEGKYLIENSTPNTIDRNTGLFWSIYQPGIIFGSIYFYLQFTGVEEVQETDRLISYVVFIALLYLGAAVFFFLKKVSPEEKNDLSHSFALPAKNETALKRCLNILRTKEMLLLATPCFFTGLQQAFMMGLFPTLVTYTKSFAADSVKLIGMYGIFNGFGEILGGSAFLFGGRYIQKNRTKVAFFGFLCNIITFALIYLNHPNDSTYKETLEWGYFEPRIWISMICSFLLGITDCCFNAQIIALIRIIYSDPIDISCSFAAFRFIQSVGSSLSFFYSSFDPVLYVHLIILSSFAFLNIIQFFLIERFITA